MKVVLLPGMDGTGELLEPLAAELRQRGLEPDIIRYPHDQPQSYAELIEDLVQPALPRDEPFVLLGESFSGPIVLALAQREVARLCGLVLVVTFAEPPESILLSLSRVMPLKQILSAPIPCWLAHKIMLGGRPVRGDQDVLCRVMKRIQPEVLATRFREVRELRLARKTIQLPALYLRATEDLLLSPTALAGVRALIPAMEVVDIAGPHLLLDTDPDTCSDHIARFVASIAARPIPQ